VRDFVRQQDPRQDPLWRQRQFLDLREVFVQRLGLILEVLQDPIRQFLDHAAKEAGIDPSLRPLLEPVELKDQDPQPAAWAA
jgi:hypothetical protein